MSLIAYWILTKPLIVSEDVSDLAIVLSMPSLVTHCHMKRDFYLSLVCAITEASFFHVHCCAAQICAIWIRFIVLKEFKQSLLPFSTLTVFPCAGLFLLLHRVEGLKTWETNKSITVVSVAHVNVVKRFMIRSTSLNEGLFCHIMCVCVCMCGVCVIWTWCTEVFVLWSAVVLICKLCPCLYIRWGLHGIMIIIINSDENHWRKWYFKSADIIKKHQRDKCCLDVCLLVGNKQVFLWSGSHMEKNGNNFLCCQKLCCAQSRLQNKFMSFWWSENIKIAQF